MNRRTLMLGAPALLAAPALLHAGPAMAQAPATPGPAFHRVPVGSLEAVIVTDGAVPVADARGMVANATPEQAAAALRAAGIQGNGITSAFNVTVIRTPRGLVMLDVGRGAANSQMLANMRAAGLDPAQVVLVVHTHFHGDHIGGLTTDAGAAVFPNAQILVPEREWAFWTDAGEESRAPEARRPGFANVRRRFAPYEGKVTRFAPGSQVAPGITSVATNGHSPGHNSFLVADGNAQLLVIGDAVVAPAFFVANPEWYPGFDMDPPTAVASRRALLDRAAADRLQVVGYHWEMPATGRIERAGTGFRMVPAGA
jgi:glyoxylase-like metal-dependent hydrolase (beta-lactamase superfamily II)